MYSLTIYSTLVVARDYLSLEAYASRYGYDQSHIEWASTLPSQEDRSWLDGIYLLEDRVYLP